MLYMFNIGISNAFPGQLKYMYILMKKDLVCLALRRILQLFRKVLIKGQYQWFIVRYHRYNPTYLFLFSC